MATRALYVYLFDRSFNKFSGLVNSYILYPVKRYDLKGGRLLKLQEKYYAVDMGMRRMALGNQVRDTGRILENIVFLELLRREEAVFVGQADDGEIDFVTEGPQGGSTIRWRNR